MEGIVQGAMAIGALLVCVIPHEVAHGYVAWKLGDPTARAAGRLSLNPIRHLDPIGSFLLPVALIILRHLTRAPLVVFGWAKPVPINPYYFRDPWQGMFWVGASGPLTNFLLAGLAAGLGRGLVAVGFKFTWPLAFLGWVVFVSLLLALFNLIPVPPLDGSRVLMYLLPGKWRPRFLRLEPIGIAIIIALLLLGVLDAVLQGVDFLWQYFVGSEWAGLI